jgi:hypothetical protein
MRVAFDACHQEQARYPSGEFTAALREVGYAGVVSAEVLSSDIRATPPAVGARALAGALLKTWPL